MKERLILYMTFSKPPMVPWAPWLPTMLAVPHGQPLRKQMGRCKALEPQQWQGPPRLLWAPSYCQEVENLVFGCLSFSGFSPSVVPTYVIPAPLRALCRYDLSHYRTWKRCHEMGTDLCQEDLDSSSSSTTDQLCGSGHISLSFQATISSFLNGNNKTYQIRVFENDIR